jgi:hypothetical protein
MLKWDIKIWEKMFEIFQTREMIESEDIWIEVVYSVFWSIFWIVFLDKFIDSCIDLFEKLDKLGSFIDISTISSCILRDDLDLSDSLTEHLPNFLDD